MSVPNGTYTDFFSSSVSTVAQDLLSTYAFASQAVPTATTQTPFLYGSKSPVTGLTAALAAKINGDGGIQRWLVNMPVNASDVELSVGGFIKGVAITKAVATVAPDKTVQAAADLAAEALDAATAAIDAANIAAENADAATAAAMEATDAVAALAVTTQAQIASMRLQNIALRKQIIACVVTASAATASVASIAAAVAASAFSAAMFAASIAAVAASRASAARSAAA